MKKTKFFKDEKYFTDSESLENEFGIKGINFAENTSILLKGEISFSNNISFSGKNVFSNGTRVFVGAVLENVIFGEDNKIREYSIIKNSNFGKSNILGPFCFIRDNSFIGNNCIVGNQVELTRSRLLNNIKISHQAFIGDATIADDVIVGAGVIFCNHDGNKRHKTLIEKNVLIGSGSIIISPNHIGERAIIAAGSIVTKKIKSGETYLIKNNNLVN
tara:strand:+ start:2024 stop:2674 length:651 start_codon:yes stop_codon:yes gene_type:complete